jgi:nitric oxide synthase oxygenase domain/subunit
MSFFLTRPLTAFGWSGAATEFDVTPFQIVTLKLSR